MKYVWKILQAVCSLETGIMMQKELCYVLQNSHLAELPYGQNNLTNLTDF